MNAGVDSAERSHSRARTVTRGVGRVPNRPRAAPAASGSGTVTLDGIDQRRAFAAQYERIVLANAEHEVVDAAELVVCDAWLERLETLGANAAQLMATSRAAHDAATARVREASAEAEPGSMVRALELLEQVESSCLRNRELCREILSFAQTQLEELSRARCAREARRRVNAACVEAARHAALGTPPLPQDGS